MTETMLGVVDPLENHAVDEIEQLFEKLQVLEIHKLRSMYRTSMETARTDLHQLVSSKYRDLVKIAQDVESVTLLCQQTDSALASLSYRQAAFVPFNDSHKSAAFDSYCRNLESAHARKESRLAILNCLIQTKLTKLDLKILATNRGLRPAPFTHTCHLVYYAQVYYTIEHVFVDHLQNKSLSESKRFEALKGRLVDYIELQLVRYNAFSPQAYSRTNDTFSEKHNLAASDLMSGASLEIDDILWDDAFDDESHLLSRTNSQESFSEYMRDSPLTSRLKRYNNSILPIVNYLLVYIILNHNNPDLNTLAKVAERFLSLRKVYLMTILQEVSTKVKPTELNFFALSQYAENTFQYVTRYFCNSNNDMNAQLKAYAKPWSPSDLLGMRAWLPRDLVLFNQDIYCIDLPQLVLAELSSSLTQFSTTSLSYFSVVLNKLEKSTPQVMVADALHVYSNYINGLVQLNNLFSQAESPSLVFQSVENLSADGQNPILEQLLAIEHYLKDLVHAHLDWLSLTNPSSVLSQIANNTFCVTAKKVPFSKNLVNEMEGDMPNYIARITEFSKSISHSRCVIEQTHLWFDQYNKALSHLQKLDGEIDTDSHLARIHTLLADSDHESISWGGFLERTVKDHFVKLTNEIEQEMHEHVGLLVKVLKQALTSCSSTDMTRQYDLLDILILVDHELYMNAQGEHAHERELLEIAKQAYSNIIRGIPAMSFNDAFTNHIQTTLRLDTVTGQSTLPSRPSLFFSSLLYKLAGSFLAGSNIETSNDYSLLFAWPRFDPVFAECKQEWVNELTENAVAELKKAGNPSLDLLRIILIDLIYLNMIGGCNTTADWASGIAIKLHCTEQDAITKEELDDIVAAVSFFYDTTKTVLFPLTSIDGT